MVARGCDVAALAPENVSAHIRSAQRRAWGASSDDFVILCPARITWLKGQDVLLSALAQLPANARPFVVFAGSAEGRADYFAALERQVSEAGLTNRVNFAGLVHDMGRAYGASDLAIVPSVRSEPFGRTVVEAQAAGLPVIASDAGGFRETIISRSPENGGTGWLVPPSDATALAVAIESAMTQNATARAQMVSNGRAYVEANFRQEVMCAKTLEIYAELIGRECDG